MGLGSPGMWGAGRGATAHLSRRGDAPVARENKKTASALVWA